jgi:hypothetical protein
MKSLARLMLFFTLCFIIFFTLAGALKYLQLSVDAARTIPSGPLVTLPEFIAAFYEVFPLILYGAVLLTLSYTVRRSIPLSISILGLFVLTCAATLGISLGFLHLTKAHSIPAALFSSKNPSLGRKTLGSPGLILSQGDTVMVVLGDPGQAGSTRVVSIPERPLIYQEIPSGPNNTILALPSAPFRNEESYLMDGLFIDAKLSAAEFEIRLRENRLSFWAYGAALILLLVSLRFVLELSSWPLANLFLGAVVFRGILAFEIFIDSRIVQDFILTFFDNRIERFIVSPLIFSGLGIITLLYTLLAHLAGDKPRESRGRSSRNKKRREGHR